MWSMCSATVLGAKRCAATSMIRFSTPACTMIPQYLQLFNPLLVRTVLMYASDVHTKSHTNRFETHEWALSSVSSGFPSFDRCPVGMSQSLNIFLHRQAIRFSFGVLRDASCRAGRVRRQRPSSQQSRRIVTHHIIYRPVRSGRTAHRLGPLFYLSATSNAQFVQMSSALSGSRRDSSPTSGSYHRPSEGSLAGR
ncbi:uncharacterized protein F4807DRAFT_443119 [Annulohypoxylon truncatum]|uniref:uncharacterized protein n=1 Tax=Annulohypoxylon truncatum TaxID=327061 RepID=UPI002008A2DA|nr:uncharacterized protein F4807DRAFT_443119 [Annulohypoxylon truncatum]KAI1205382.1 hypothetical protein F4807DRAFT_443119 [Annulohypoxylon truncatum]